MRLVLLLLALSPLCCVRAADLRLPLNDWTSQRILTLAFGQYLQQKAYRIEYIEMEPKYQWGALRKGLIHVQLEVWQTSMAAQFNQMVKKGQILDLGTYDFNIMEQWWYPMYVKPLCPGLPDWKALKMCASLFSSEHSGDKGVFYTGHWEYEDAALIRRLQLNFVIQRVKDGAALWQTLRQAMQNQKPIVMLNWSPNWTDARMPGEFVQFPELDCNEQGCLKPQNGWLKRAGAPSLKQYFPCVYQMARHIDLSREALAEAAALVMVDNYEEQKAAHLWLSRYRAVFDDAWSGECHNQP